MVLRTAPGMEVHFLKIVRKALARSPLSVTVEELQSKLQAVCTFDEILDDVVFQGDDGDAFLGQWLDRIKDLWNYTPREELGGKRPVETLHDWIRQGADPGTLRDSPVIVPSDFFK